MKIKYNLDNCWKYKNDVIKLINNKYHISKSYNSNLENTKTKKQFQSLLLSQMYYLVLLKIIDDYIPEGFEMSNDIDYDNINFENLIIPNNFKFPNKCDFLWLNNSNIGDNVVYPKECRAILLQNSTIGDNVILPNKCFVILINKNTRFGDNITYPKMCDAIKIIDNPNII